MIWPRRNRVWVSFYGPGSQVVSIRPAYVMNFLGSNREASFTLALSNKGQDKIDVVINKEGDFFNPQYNTSSLFPGITKNINILTSLSNKPNQNFTGKIILNYGINIYEIPFFVKKTAYFQPIINETETIDISKISDPIYLTTLTNKRLYNLSLDINAGDYYPPGQVVVNNNAGIDLHNISYSFSGDIVGFFDVQPTSHDLVALNDSVIFLLGVNNSYYFTSGSFSGNLNVKTIEGANFSLPIYVKITNNIIIEENQTINVVNETPTNITKAEETKNKFNLFYILTAIILVILILVIILYRKSKQTKEQFKDILGEVQRKK